jgi:uncharacterized protein (TIGR02271 family)
MENKTFIGVYHSETELIAKIDELKTQGYAEEDIYVIAKDKDNISMVRGRTGADVQTAGGSWLDRFMAFMSGEEPIRGAFRNMGVSDAEADRYYTEVENGGTLLYVDREYGGRYEEGHTAAAIDPNLGGNAFAADDRLDRDRTIQEEETLQLHEERLNVNKERVQTGEVHVEKEVVEEEQVIDVPVQREEVFVERRPVAENDLTRSDDDLTAFDGRDAAFKDDGETIRVPITEERVEVTKKPVVTEEIIIGKRTVEDTETVRETVRREEAYVGEDRTKRTDRDLL